MAATQSTMLELGTQAPPFTLNDVSTGQPVSLADFSQQQSLLVIFLCAHCPYVIHVAPELARLARDYSGKSLAIVGITSNDTTEYPLDAPEPTAVFSSAQGFNFPILFDESQAVAQAYSAACTPDFFLFDAERKLVYRGQLDSSRPNRGPDRPGAGSLNGEDLRAAIDATLAGLAVNENQRPSIGCNIKWKPGNAPKYFAH
ncbi:MAG: thioredoxin family protein [Verrucomicrobiota bacterium]